MAPLAGSSKLLRVMNESAALAHLLDPGHLTRADLRRLTALSTPTISDVLRRLTEAGLVTVVGHNSGRPGPNAEVYAANPDAASAAAISVRPGSVAAALCDLTGTVRARFEAGVDFAADGPVPALTGVVARLCDEAGVPAAGVRHVQVGVPGSYNARTGTIRHVDVPGFARSGLVPELASTLGTSLVVENDVNLAAVAERRRGTGRGEDGFALLWIGEDGLGLAIDLGGTLMRGAHGSAGAIGYMPLYDPEAPHRKLDLQDLFGGAAVLGLADDHGLAAPAGRSPADVVRAAAADPQASGDFLPRLADRIAVGLAAVTAVLDPSLLVLAGPIAQAGGEILLAEVAAAARRVTPLQCDLAITTLTDDAVLLGALDAGLQAVHESLIAAIREG